MFKNPPQPMMFERSKDLQRKSFITSVILIFLLTIIGWFQFQSILKSQREISNSQKITLHLSGILSGVIEIEKTYPFYYATKDPQLSAFYQKGKESIESSLQEIIQISFQDHEQPLIDSLNILTYHYLNSIKGFEIGSSLVNTDFLVKFRNIHRLPLIVYIATWNQRESQLLEESQLVSDKAIQTIVVLLVVMVILLFLIAVFFNGEITSSLTFQIEFLRFSETIAGIGSCSYDFKKNELAFSNNFYKLLGHLPGSFVPSREKLLGFVHPDDRANVDETLQFDMVEGKLPTLRFRIIREDGDILNISLTQQYLEQKSLKNLVLVFKDVTEETLINTRLQEQNKQLEQNVVELDSFNHIASHDLQEPLRKIQTIISRLKTMDDLHLTEKAADYFSRIQGSANTMQNLILDLLTYSGISKIEKAFVKLPFGLVLEKVVEELNLMVSEKNAVIDFSQIPTATVIPYQIQQLFINLLTNSLKYSKPNVAPLICIKHEKISEDELAAFPDIEEDDLVKISVEDNGIGFDQNHALNIFVLFRRLHSKSKYPGTGIGLAICKKIVENHKGIIFATGILGQGAKVTFIIPK